MSGELGIVDRIQAALRVAPSLAAQRGLLLGIGDDAALVRPRGRDIWVFSTDSFFENVHFLGSVHAPRAVGYKSLARAVSDLAAMGAAPRFFLLTLALPGLVRFLHYDLQLRPFIADKPEQALCF